MHCPHCKAPMYQTGEVVESNSRQTWHECSTCGTVETVSRPAPDRRGECLGNGIRFSAQPQTRN